MAKVLRTIPGLSKHFLKIKSKLATLNYAQTIDFISKKSRHFNLNYTILIYFAPFVSVINPLIFRLIIIENNLFFSIFSFTLCRICSKLTSSIIVSNTICSSDVSFCNFIYMFYRVVLIFICESERQRVSFS